MEKVKLGPRLLAYPMPAFLVGANVEGKPNFATVAWGGVVCGTPPLIAVSLRHYRYTYKGIKENGTFSINIPSTPQVIETDYCGIVSGESEDKAKLFSIFYGELKTAPMIRECPVCLECRLIQAVNYPTNEFFIGEIMASYTEERYLTREKLDMKKIDPILLSMPDNRYWTLGEHAGDAWSIGKSLK